MSAIETIKKYGKSAQGRKELLKHLRGGKLSYKQAILAECYYCTCYYADGKNDCEMPECSLYPFMPYNPNKITRKLKISEAERIKRRDRLSKSRK